MASQRDNKCGTPCTEDDGDDSKLPAFATATAQGAIKWKQVTGTGVAADDFTADLNAGYIDHVFAVTVFWHSRAYLRESVPSPPRRCRTRKANGPTPD